MFGRQWEVSHSQGGGVGPGESSELVGGPSPPSPLHYCLSFLVKNCMSAFGRDVHCLFGLFIFAWLKYFGIFPDLMRDKNVFIFFTLRIQGRRVYGGQQEKKCPKCQLCFASQYLQVLEWTRSRSELCSLQIISSLWASPYSLVKHGFVAYPCFTQRITLCLELPLIKVKGFYCFKK